MADNNTQLPVGPALGNVPTPDYYLRIKQNIDALLSRTTQLANQAAAPKPLTPVQLTQVQKSLQAGGTNVINVTSLPGVLIQPQNSSLPEVTSLPFSAGSTEGQTVLYHHTIWRFSKVRLKWEEVSIIAIQDTANNIGLYAANNYGPGVLLDKTDWTVVYINRNNNWVYLTGIYNDVLANIPGNLNANDLGMTFAATDYKHIFEWNGAVWDFAGGDAGSKYIVAGIAAPLGGLWALCDGSNATVAQNNGTTVVVTTPNLGGDIFIKGGNYNGTRQAATSPTWAANAATDSANISITAASNNFTANATGVAALISAVNSPNPHSHNLSNNNAVINPPSEANNGLPLRIALQWYMRR